MLRGSGPDGNTSGPNTRKPVPLDRLLHAPMHQLTRQVPDATSEIPETDFPSRGLPSPEIPP